MTEYQPHIATDAVRKQLKKVLDRGNNRQKAEQVRKTLQGIRNRNQPLTSGDTMKNECTYKKVTSAKAAGHNILVEMLTEQEAAGSVIVVSQQPSKEAYIKDIGALVSKDCGFKKGDRVFLQGQYVPLPVKSEAGRTLGIVNLQDIKAVLVEE